jgi:hypothetical protein
VVAQIKMPSTATSSVCAYLGNLLVSVRRWKVCTLRRSCRAQVLVDKLDRSGATKNTNLPYDATAQPGAAYPFAGCVSVGGVAVSGGRETRPPIHASHPYLGIPDKWPPHVAFLALRHRVEYLPIMAASSPYFVVAGWINPAALMRTDLDTTESAGL